MIRLILAAVLVAITGCGNTAPAAQTSAAVAPAAERDCKPTAYFEQPACRFTLDALVQFSAPRVIGVQVAGYLREKDGEYVLARENKDDSLSVKIGLKALGTAAPAPALIGSRVEAVGLYDSTVSPARSDKWVYGTLKVHSLQPLDGQR